VAPRIEPKKKERIIADLRAGVFVREVASRYDCSEAVVRVIRAEAGIAPLRPRKGPGPKRYVDITLRLTAPVHSLLVQAAARRNMSPASAAGEIVQGVVCRGSIYHPPDVGRALRMSQEYKNARPAVVEKSTGMDQS
jgi:hypothetical protein